VENSQGGGTEDGVCDSSKQEGKELQGTVQGVRDFLSNWLYVVEPV
jgi:hypothetical protein